LLEFVSNYMTDLIGITGTALALVAYFLLQMKKLPSEGVLFSLLNALGSLLILVSLVYSWNLASFVMESAWLCASFYGVYAARRIVS